MPVSRGFDVLRMAAASPLQGRPSAARARLRREALDLVQREALVDAAYSYRVVPLDTPAKEVLCAGGEQLPAPWLLPDSGELTAIACGVCTLGSALEQRVGALFAERRASLALALDDLGNELLFAVSRRAQDRMQADATRRKLAMAGELHAGDPGLALGAQAAVLRLAQADTIGIGLTRGNLMHPLKSTSMVLGVGIDLPATTWSRCERCPSQAKCGRRPRAESSAMTAATTRAA